MRRSDPTPALALVALLTLGSAAARAEDPPRLASGELPGRVVSMNLCTDQLAILLAAPGQLVSVSYLATDPLASSMPDAARGIPQNRGQAEQIFLMRPDLVLAGSYTSVASVSLLERLGVRVLRIAPVNSLADVAAQMREVGGALGRPEAGEAMARAFEAGVEDLRLDLPPASAALYAPNGYTTGTDTVSDEILRLTAFHNIAADAGLSGGGTLPLERLVMAAPQVIVTSRPYPGASRSEEILVHPALRAVQQRAAARPMSDADWICGTPYMLRAIRAMADSRKMLERQGGGAD